MAASTATYLGFATQQDAALRSAMDQVINASLSHALPALHWLAVAYIVITFAVVAGNGMTMNTFIARMIRLFVVVTLIQTSGFYVTHVRDLLFDQVPTELAQVVSGTPNLTSAAQQFDIVSQAADNLVADAQAKNTWFTADGIGNAVGARLADIGINLAGAVEFAIWMLGRKLMAIVLCFGPWLLLFELFDRTRGWVSQWLGKLVGLLVFQLAADVLLQIDLRGIMTILQSVHNNPGASVDEMVSMLFHVAAFFTTDALTMIALPTICAIGSGAAAGHGVAAAIGMGALGRGMSNLGRGMRAMAKKRA